MHTDFRMALQLTSAERSLRALAPPAKGNSLATKAGLRYERRVGKQLARFVDEGRFARIEHNPWFVFRDIYGASSCSPDYLLHNSDGSILIVEVKLTYVDVAIAKLNELYYPVITKALNVRASPLIICRNLTPNSPRAETQLSRAINSAQRLLYWPEIGQIPW